MTRRPTVESPGLVAFLVLAAIAGLLGALSLPFIYDDIPLIRDNPGLRDLVSLRQLAGPLYYKEFGVGNYHPLPLLIWFSLRALLGPIPFVFHALSLTLHVGNTLLAYRLGLRLWGRSSGFNAALAATILWAVSPLHTQTVFVAAFLPDLLCAFFSMGSLLFYLERRGDGSAGVKALVMMALALMCKETAAVLPLVFFALSRLGKDFPKRRLTPFLILIAVYTVFRLVVINDLEMIVATPDLSGEPWDMPLLRLLTALRLAVWPWPLSLLRSPPGWGLLREPSLWLGLGVLGVAAWGGRRDRAALAISATWIMIWLAPFINIIPLGHAREYFASRFFSERYLYLASLGVFWILVRALARWAPSGIRWTVLSLAVALSIAGGWTEAWRYRDPIRHWEHVIRISPSNAWARNILGVALLEEGAPTEALWEFEEAARLGGGSSFERSVTYANIGAAQNELGDYAGAEASYRHALAIDPSNEYLKKNVRYAALRARGLAR